MSTGAFDVRQAIDRGSPRIRSRLVWSRLKASFEFQIRRPGNGGFHCAARLGRYLSGVKLSVKSDYAARAILGLARHFPSGMAVRVDALAKEQGIPPNYLVQILIELKSAQLVQSQRGKEGGYFLARPPGKISLGDVLRAIHGQVFDTPALADAKCAPELRDAWRRLQGALESAANNIRFQQLVDAGEDKGKMYYI